MLGNKIIKFSWLLILLYIFLIQSNYTDADIFAERTITENRMTAIVLDFSTRKTFNNNITNNLFSSFGFLPGGVDVAGIRIKGETDQDFKYYLKTIRIDGDDNFCENLQVRALDKNFKTIYNGSISDLALQSTISGEGNNYWIFAIGFNNTDANLKNKRCEFDFYFRTYRQNTNEEGGIFAERKINNVVASGEW